MLAIILILTALTVGLFALTLLQMRPGQDALLGRLDQLQPGGNAQDAAARRRRQVRSERLMSVLQALGQQVGSSRKDATAIRMFLIQAGFSDPRAVSIYWASRVSLAVGLPIVALFGLPVLGVGSVQVILAVLYFGAMGWIGPTFYVRRRMKARQKEVQLALPDM